MHRKCDEAHERVTVWLKVETPIANGRENMIAEYIHAALTRATYERIEDKGNRYYGQVPVLKGVWATGRTLGECRNHLAEVVEGWLIVRLRKGLAIPPIGKHQVKAARAIRFGT